MELRKGPMSFLNLLLLALKTTNRAFGSVLFLLICVGLLSALLAVLTVGAAFLFGPKLAMVLQIPVSFFSAFLQTSAMLAIVALLGAKLEKQGLSPLQALRGALLPTFYFFIDSIILTLVAVLVLGLAYMFGSSKMMLTAMLVLFLTFLPFIFLQPILVLRDEGPISAIGYCIELAKAYYLRILLNLAGLALLGLLVLLGGVCVLKALAPEQFSLISGLMTSPQMAAMAPMLLSMQLMQLPKLTLLLIAVGVALAYLFLYVFGQSFLTALFLNLDHDYNGSQTRDMGDVIAKEPPAVHGHSPVHAVSPQVGVKQASIHTLDAEDFSHHLDKVYDAKEHLAQALEQEEDRMPTILFDEEMAKQLEQSQQEMQKQKDQSTKNKEDNGPQSIKMSDKPL